MIEMLRSQVAADKLTMRSFLAYAIKFAPIAAFLLYMPVWGVNHEAAKMNCNHLGMSRHESEEILYQKNPDKVSKFFLELGKWERERVYRSYGK